MKRSIIIISLFVLVIPVMGWAKTTGDIGKWVTGIAPGTDEIAGYTIKKYVEEKSSGLLMLSKEPVNVKVTMINKISYTNLEACLEMIDTKILGTGRSASDPDRSVVITEVEVSVSFNDAVTITTKVSSFTFRVNEDFVIDLASLIKSNPLFYYNTKSKKLTYAVEFSDIALKTGTKDAFRGWGQTIDALVKWFQAGIERKDQLATTLIVKTSKRKGHGAKVDMDLSYTNQTKVRIGIILDHFFPNILSGQAEGILASSLSYNMFQSFFFINIREIGSKTWDYKPFAVNILLGAFMELNFNHLSRLEYTDFDANRFLGYGIAIGTSFSFYVPEVRSGEINKDIVGTGIEFIVNFNLNQEYYYFVNMYGTFVVHLLPFYKIKPEVLTGFNISINTLDNMPYLSSYGLMLGIRARFDLHEFKQ